MLMQPRKRHPGIDNPLDHQVQLATEESGRAADQHRNQDVEAGRDHAHEHGNPSPVDIAAQEVAPQLIGTHQMLGRRGLQQRSQVHFIENRHQNQAQYDHAASGAERLSTSTPMACQ